MSHKNTFLENILQKTVYFLFIYSILLILLYLLGNYQFYLERTQYLLLSLLEITSLVGVILGFYCLLYNVIFFVLIKIYKLPADKKVFRIIMNLIIIFISISIFILLKMLIVWFSPY